jgi:GxxExxY protein
MKHEALTGEIIRIFFNVYNELGYGFLEKVYQKAFCLALEAEGFKVEEQKQITVYFRGHEIGTYFADLVINDTIIIELKAVECINPAHEKQLLHYLRSTEIEVGLLFNFGTKPEFKRKAYDNNIKPNLTKRL